MSRLLRSTAWRRVLPTVATIAVVASAVAAWFFANDEVFQYAVYPVVGLVAILLLFDRIPLAVSMAVLLALVTGFAIVANVAPIMQDGEEAIPEFPPVAQAPLSAGLGILALVVVLVARHRTVEPRGLLYGSLFVAWLAFSALFFIPPETLGDPLSVAALPGLLALALAGLAGWLTVRTRGHVETAAPGRRP